ncbi:MAG: hypothetical protein Q9225_004105 [Loekoesia sp. 1 TL-2023]
MPAVVDKRKNITLTSSTLQYKAVEQHHAASTMTQTIRFHNNVRSESSEADCKGYKLRGIDTGPCGNSVINYTSISLIIFVVVSLCLATYMKISRSKRTALADVRPQPVINPYQNQHRERQKREQQERTIQQRLHDERRRQNIPARAVTDLSGQQTQLAERLNQLQEQLESALQEQESRANEAVADGSGPLAPEAAHIPGREREWERYQMRSNQDIMTRLERAGSIIQRIRSNEEESRGPNTPWLQRQVSEQLPEYAAEDPLADQISAPAYTL